MQPEELRKHRQKSVVEVDDEGGGWRLSQDRGQELGLVLTSKATREILKTRGPFGETFLHFICVTLLTIRETELYKFRHAIARYLIEHNDELADGGLVDSYYKESFFYGETAAHVCAAQGEYSLFLALLKAKADVVNPRCYGAFFLDWDCDFLHLIDKDETTGDIFGRGARHLVYCDPSIWHEQEQLVGACPPNFEDPRRPGAEIEAFSAGAGDLVTLLLHPVADGGMQAHVMAGVAHLFGAGTRRLIGGMTASPALANLHGLTKTKNKGIHANGAVAHAGLHPVGDVTEKESGEAIVTEKWQVPQVGVILGADPVNDVYFVQPQKNGEASAPWRKMRLRELAPAPKSAGFLRPPAEGYLYLGERIINFVACSEYMSKKRKLKLINECLVRFQDMKKDIALGDTVKIKDEQDTEFNDTRCMSMASRLKPECSVFVGNIADSLAEETFLESAFGVHGAVEQVFVRRKPGGGAKNWAIVVFKRPSMAQSAKRNPTSVDVTHGQKLHGFDLAPEKMRRLNRPGTVKLIFWSKEQDRRRVFRVQSENECSDYEEHEIDLVRSASLTLNMPDVLGNTILHNVVLFDVKYQRGTIMELYPDLVALGADQTILNKGNRTALAMACCQVHKKSLGPAQVGAPMVTAQQFRTLIECFRTTLWQYGPLGSYTYDLSTIDSLGKDGMNQNSVLAICVDNQQKSLLLENRVLKHVLEQKWIAFAKREYWTFLLFHVCQLCAVSTAIWSRDAASMRVDPDAALEYSAHAPGVHTVTGPTGPGAGHVRLIAESCTILGALTFAALELMEARAQGLATYLFSLNTVENVLTWMHVFFVLSALTGKLLQARRIEALAMSMTALSAWLHTLYFLRSVSKNVGQMIICVQKIVGKDMKFFMFLYGFIIIAFGQALYAIYSFNYKENAFDSPGYGLLQLFKSDMGGEADWDLPTDPSLGKDYKGWDDNMGAAAILLYIMHAFTTSVLLLNLLIAMMGHTFTDIWDKAESYWWLERAEMTLMYESRLWCRMRWLDHMNQPATSFNFANPGPGVRVKIKDKASRYFDCMAVITAEPAPGELSESARRPPCLRVYNDRADELDEGEMSDAELLESLIPKPEPNMWLKIKRGKKQLVVGVASTSVYIMEETGWAITLIERGSKHQMQQMKKDMDELELKRSAKEASAATDLLSPHTPSKQKKGAAGRKLRDTVEDSAARAERSKAQVSLSGMTAAQGMAHKEKHRSRGQANHAYLKKRVKNVKSELHTLEQQERELVKRRQQLEREQEQLTEIYAFKS